MLKLELRALRIAAALEWLQSRIVFDHDLGGVVLTANRKFQIVSTGFERQSEGEDVAETTATTASASTTTSTTTGTWTGSRTRRRIAAKVPLHPV